MFQQFKNIYHFLVAWIFEILYGLPARKLKVIGITGTDGKTTTSSLIFHVLKSAGKKVSMITSVSAVIGGRELDTGFHVTTPDPHDIPRYMAESVRNGDEYFILEITSHGLDQHRAARVRFEISGITNITHEHLGYHKTFERYVRAKSQIARMSKTVVVNADQPDVLALIRSFAPSAYFVTYGLRERADYSQDIGRMFHRDLEKYNHSNFLLAYAICAMMGVSDEVFGQAVRTFAPPPGRMEVLYDDDFTVISDFAHTPNALEQALSAIVHKYPQRNRLIHVFGAAAYRDDMKRPAMGEASARYADLTILTEEDYRTENPERIFEMLGQGLRRGGMGEIEASTPADRIAPKQYMCILNREEAIQRAVRIAMPGDIIIITGKGVEKSLCRGKREYPYDERECVLRAIQSRETSARTS